MQNYQASLCSKIKLQSNNMNKLEPIKNGKVSKIRSVVLQPNQ